MTNRRTFLKSTTTAAVGLSLAATMPIPMSACAGANDKLRCGVIGVNGMGFADLSAFLRQKNTECVAMCDVDSNVLSKRAAETEKIQGSKPKLYSDYRKLLEDKNVDVVIIGTLTTGIACQWLKPVRPGKMCIAKNRWAIPSKKSTSWNAPPTNIKQ